MRKLLPAKPYACINRRHFLAALGGGLIATLRAVAAWSDQAAAGF